MSISPPENAIVGILLAAGAGRRMGMPKALVRGADGVPWVERGVRRLLDGGCARVVVVLGADASTARGLVPDEQHVSVVVAAEWESGMAASLAAGLRAVAAMRQAGVMDASAAVITLVDLPGLAVSTVRRVIGDAPALAPTPSTLRRATYGGAPGHPVLIGRDHWVEIAGDVSGDSGARRYLLEHDAASVECGDLWGGHDIDEPETSTRYEHP